MGAFDWDEPACLPEYEPACPLRKPTDTASNETELALAPHRASDAFGPL